MAKDKKAKKAASKGTEVKASKRYRQRANKGKGKRNAKPEGFCMDGNARGTTKRKYRGITAEDVQLYRPTPEILNTKLDAEIKRVLKISLKCHDPKTVNEALNNVVEEHGIPKDLEERGALMAEALSNAMATKRVPDLASVFWGAVNSICKAGLNMRDKAHKHEYDRRKMGLVMYRKAANLEIPKF